MLKCKDLERAFEFRLGKYIAARSTVYYRRVSTELAACKKVDMERARNDLEEHRLICASAAALKRLNKWPTEAVVIMGKRFPQQSNRRLRVLTAGH